MQSDPRGYLWDIRDAADAINDFIKDVSLETYATSPLIHSAVERKFEIIGEALNQLSKVDPAFAGRIPEIERIIAFRNLLIHGYAVVDHGRVWDIAKKSLPELRRVANLLLTELE